MRNQTIVDQILDHIASIDYTTSSSAVNLFETTIRYLGGMVAAHDLLSGPFKGLTKNPNASQLVPQAKQLANAVKFAFRTPSGIPSNNLNLTSQMPTSDNGGTGGLAIVGSLVLEWQRLSDLTGDAEYGTLATIGESHILHPKPSYNEPWPGLLGTRMNLTTGLFVDADGGWAGRDDSGYEYMIKMYAYNTEKNRIYKDRWLLAADSSMKYLASQSPTQHNATWLARYNNHTLASTSDHLACFAGGNFILGGMVTNNRTLQDFGLLLTDSCYRTYTATATGIGPEMFSWSSSTVPQDQAAFFQQHGFHVLDKSYDLRPEVLESIYYAYRLTTDEKYQDMAWDAFVAINSTARSNYGYSAITDVTIPGGGQKSDMQESFLFAELMKYAYIIHTPDSTYQVNSGGKTNFVLNTEAQ